MTIEQVVLIATAISGGLAAAVVALWRATEKIRDQQVKLVEMVTTVTVQSNASLDKASAALGASAASITQLAHSVDRLTVASTTEHKAMLEAQKSERRTDRDDATRRRNAEYEGR
jgi:hypothetical protein